MLLTGEVESLKAELEQVGGERDYTVDQLQVTQAKLKTLTEYFEQKEHSLHRKLGVEEYARREFEGREASAKEKVLLNDQERERERFALFTFVLVFCGNLVLCCKGKR